MFLFLLVIRGDHRIFLIVAGVPAVDRRRRGNNRWSHQLPMRAPGLHDGFGVAVNIYDRAPPHFYLSLSTWLLVIITSTIDQKSGQRYACKRICMMIITEWGRRRLLTNRGRVGVISVPVQAKIDQKCLIRTRRGKSCHRRKPSENTFHEVRSCSVQWNLDKTDMVRIIGSNLGYE